MAEDINSELQNFKQVSSLLNFAHPTNWVLEIPINSVGLGNELKDLGYDHRVFAMNVASFTLGRMTLNGNEVKRVGYTLSYPSGTEDTEKEFTINYRLSSEYQQYYFLCRWWQKNLDVTNHLPGADDAGDKDFFLTNINLWILNDNKDPVMKISYQDCWLNELGELQLSYADSNSFLEHSFTCKYNDFKINYLNPKNY